MRNINWPEVFAGFALGFAPLVFRQLYIFYAFMRQSNRNKYLGRWWQYHRSTTGSGKVRETEVEIRFSLLFNRLIITESSADPTIVGLLRYTGELSSRQGMVR